MWAGRTSFDTTNAMTALAHFLDLFPFPGSGTNLRINAYISSVIL